MPYENPSKKTALKQFFEAGSPWAILILNNMYGVGVLYCVKFFFLK